MEVPIVIRKVALAHIKDRKLIMVRSAKNDEVFYTLGGKIERNESEIECLHREVKEEIDVEIADNSLTFLREFEGDAHGKENAKVNIKLYYGEIVGEPKASNEIAEVQYFDTGTDRKHLGMVSIEILNWLQAQGYVD
jgi:8-oxo-dGTP diphosphatase